jgi:hypothetical protein
VVALKLSNNRNLKRSCPGRSTRRKLLPLGSERYPEFSLSEVKVSTSFPLNNNEYNKVFPESHNPASKMSVLRGLRFFSK